MEDKRANRALQGTDESFRSIFENAQIGIAIYNIQSGEHFSNHAMHEMLGYSQEELRRTEQWDQIVHPDEREVGAQRYAEMVQGRRDEDEWEQRFIRRDGGIVIAGGRFKLIRDGEGKPLHIVALNEDITERRRSAEALAASERLFRSIFENAQIGISFFNIDGQAVFTNRAFQEMLGYTEKELSQLEKWDEIIHPDERVSGAERYAELVQGKHEKDEWEQRFIRHDGRLVVTSSRFSLIRDEAGIPQYVAALTEDITESKRAQEERNRVTQQMQMLLASTGQGIYGIDLHGKCTFINRAASEMLGYSPDEALGQTMHDLIHHHKGDGSNYPGEDYPVYRALQKGEGCRLDTEVLWRRDGSAIPVEYSSFPIREGGRTVGAVVTVVDITERKRDKEALQASEQLFRSIFENAQIGISVVNLAEKKYHTNRALQDMLGRTHEELDSVEKWDQIVHPDERDSGAQRYAQLLRGERDNDEWEQRFVRPGGRIVIADGRFSAIRDAAGKPLYVLYMTEDVTDRKRAEAELVAAKEAAVAATRAKSDFLANMSHEIRTPMNAVLGMMHLALKTELTSRQRDYLTKAKAAADTLLGIINDILDFSKIEAGKLEMEHTEFRLDVVLADFSTVVSHKAHEKNLEFLVATEGNVPAALVGDPLRLGQVLINLVNNAVKFTERGEIVVTVKVQERVGDRVKLKFAVRDSGIGMTPDQTARLFQAFSQADTSTTRRYGGTGLGLSISKRFVEMMEGNIWVESEYGHGSTFCFTAWFGAGAAERRQKFIPPGLTGLRALVVDDNAAAREILSDILRQFTFRVECVPSGTGALRELVSADTEDPYRLVLMDWQMPGLDGLETGRRIKRAGTLRNVPKIVGVTAFDREDIRDQAQEIEIEGLLLKPVSPFVLFDMVMSIFGVAGEEEKAPRSIGKDNDLYLVRGIRVLLVEDNEVNQQVATELLESEGAIVTIANHGAEAVRILTQGNEPVPFDVVLMDLQMPEMDGLTATRVLRAQADLQQLPIIAMTAHVMADEVQRCLEAGMNDHVAKPIDPEAFFSTLARWTRAHQREIADMEARTVSSEAEIMLPEVEGVDVAAGLQRVAGNKRLYHEMLLRFAQKHGTTGDQIAVAIESGDRNHAANLAHSLKGVAGNLGINTISRLAGNLEQAIRQSLGGVQGMVNVLASALDRQAQNIQDVLKVTTPSAEKSEGGLSRNSVAVSAAVARLRQLLEASNADSLKAYADLVEILQGAVDPSRLETLGAAVSAFRFETALVKLDEIANQYGASQSEKKDA